MNPVTDQGNPNNRLSQIVMVNEIASILYQVTDFDTALDMILDTVSEYLKYKPVGIWKANNEDGQYDVIKSRDLDESIRGGLSFSLNETINGQTIPASQWMQIDLGDSMLRIGQRPAKKLSAVTTIFLFPVNYRDRLMGFLGLFLNKGQRIPDDYDIRLLNIVATQAAPVLFSFETLRKPDQNYESIIAKIIRDRMYEAQLVLSPISFSVFRITPACKFEHTLPLEDAIRTYQKLFHDRLEPLGDLIWLTLDTIFFVYPRADLFQAESICARLHQEVEEAFSGNNSGASFILKYVCLGYPQSGKNATEIINALWFRLFEELSEQHTLDSSAV